MRNVIPKFPNVDLEVTSDDDGKPQWICYTGNEDEISAAGIVPVCVIAKRDPKAPRPQGGRRDRDGDKVRVSRWNCVRAGKVVPRIRLGFLNKSLSNAMKLPGFNVAWNYHLQILARAEEIRADRAVRDTVSPDQERRGAINGVTMFAAWEFLKNARPNDTASAAEGYTILRDLLDLVQLAPLRDISATELGTMHRDGVSLQTIARYVRSRPLYGETRPAGGLRLVVDNTR